MDDAAARRARLGGWANLMKRFGVPIPDPVRRDLLPRTGPGTFGGYAMSRTQPQPRTDPPKPPQRKWRGFTPGGPQIGPGAEQTSARVKPPAPERVFPVTDPPPWRKR